jgi:hypothetical protein
MEMGAGHRYRNIQKPIPEFQWDSLSYRQPDGNIAGFTAHFQEILEKEYGLCAQQIGLV